ncbi:TatD family hydrolase [Chlamydiifrater phoenicopteri]|uniref:TatD family hydrolase n=1 Tax=Chlamydiifrater phoenicopteri TaxID=2681469 RepID=UPI001BCF190D|nr:TatD family hydrolase [Chlamydiifrater phoenicopteri]
MSLIDAHLHLADESFQNDIREVLSRAEEGGIATLLNVSTTQQELCNAFHYAETTPNITFLHAAGTPPQDALGDIEADFDFFAKAAKEGKLVAVGEVGLDYGFVQNDQEKARQQEVFKRYLSLAIECALPPVIHCRNAFEDFFSILDSDYRNGRPGMLHCFTGSSEEAAELVKRGWYISISGIVTFKNAESLREVLRTLPLEQLLIETDAPYLAPVPFRGKKNEPSFIRHTFEKISSLKGVPVSELANIVKANMHQMLSS